VEVFGDQEAEVPEVTACELLGNVLDSDIGLSDQPNTGPCLPKSADHSHDRSRDDSLRSDELVI
jgi:hypothetical protein